MLSICATFLFIVTSCQEVSPANILAILPMPHFSHEIWCRSLLDELAVLGHKVTALSLFPDKGHVPNYNTILMEGVYEFSKGNIDYSSLAKDSKIKTLVAENDLFDFMHTVLEKGMRSNGTKTLLKLDIKFDLVITDVTYGECFLGIVHKLGSPPVIALSPFGFHSWLNYHTGTPNSPSYIPHTLVPVGDHMGFLERVVNFLTNVYAMADYWYFQLPLMDRYARAVVGATTPSVSEIGSRISLVLVNVNKGMDYPRPLVPNMIPVGGMHLKPARRLPEELLNFLDSAEHGVILFSLGTNVRSSKLRADILDAILGAFGELPQSVLWKCESTTLPGLPSNVKLSSWLPQNDVLGHANVRLFVTHGGKLSLQEAVYHGVPLVAIPFFADQPFQVEKIVNRGVGVRLDFLTLTKAKLLASIHEVMNNASYVTNMRRLSVIFRDVPMSPLNTAVYWTEYVLRHKGAGHLRSAGADIPWYQYLLLDVLAALLAVGVVAVLLLVRAVRLVAGAWLASRASHRSVSYAVRVLRPVGQVTRLLIRHVYSQVKTVAKHFSLRPKSI